MNKSQAVLLVLVVVLLVTNMVQRYEQYKRAEKLLAVAGAANRESLKALRIAEGWRDLYFLCLTNHGMNESQTTLEDL